MPCIGILGGSFNPPHRGHLSLALTVLGLAMADKVCLIPAASPPHKVLPREADPATRFAMAELLAGEDARLHVDDIELRRSGPSYTIDTIRELAAKQPGCCFRIIIGSDLAKTFSTWREYRELMRIAPPLIAERPDSPFAGNEDFVGLEPAEIERLLQGRFVMQPMDVSSTKVRGLFAEGAEDAELLRYLTAPVLSFIRARHLYEPLG